MRRIAYTRPDGGVSVVHPCISAGDPPEMTEEEALARALAKDVPANAQNVTVIEPTALPSDRSKRYAWRILAGVIVVDPTVPEPEPVRKARRIQELKDIRKTRAWLESERQEMLDLLAGVS